MLACLTDIGNHECTTHELLFDDLNQMIGCPNKLNCILWFCIHLQMIHAILGCILNDHIFLIISMASDVSWEKCVRCVGRAQRHDFWIFVASSQFLPPTSITYEYQHQWKGRTLSSFISKSLPSFIINFLYVYIFIMKVLQPFEGN